MPIATLDLEELRPKGDCQRHAGSIAMARWYTNNFVGVPFQMIASDYEFCWEAASVGATPEGRAWAV
jgi:hypothetical protein